MSAADVPFASEPPGPTPALDRDASRALHVRRDGPALLRGLVQLGVLGVGLTAAGVWGAAGDPRWALGALLAGCGVLALFPTLHEAGHRSAFATGWLNEVATCWGALAMLQAPTFFREFHFEHHRSTQDRERDPEIARAPDLLDDWPRHLPAYLFVVSGQPLMLGKLGFTAACGVLPERHWTRLFPFVRASLRRRVAWESRLVLGVLGGSAGLGLAWLPGFGYALVAWPVAHLLLGLYLLPEHTGLPNEGSQLERTRSVTSHSAVRWWMWNMPYHAEHHLLPAVPFHQLPRLSDRLGAAVLHRAPGYLAFHAEALRRAMGRVPAAHDPRA